MTTKERVLYGTCEKRNKTENKNQKSQYPGENAKAQADIRFLRSRGVEIDPKSNASSAFKSAGKIVLAMERGIYIGDYLAVKYVKSQIGSVKDPVSGKTIKDGNKRRVEEDMKQIGLTQDQIEFMQEVLY